MTQRGGQRAGAGRKPGSKSRTPVAAMPVAVGKQMPVDYMLSILHDDEADEKARAWAAEKAAPYLHPKPAPIPRLVQVNLPDTNTVEGVRDAIGKLIQAVAAGKLAPSEAQSIAALIEGQRKAIETADFLPRLEELERAAQAANPHRLAN